LFDDPSYKGGKQLRVRCTDCTNFQIVVRKKLNSSKVMTFQIIEASTKLNHCTVNSTESTIVECKGGPVKHTSDSLHKHPVFQAMATQRSTHLHRSRISTDTALTILAAACEGEQEATTDVYKKVDDYY